MPLYEYACGECQAESEILVRSASEVPECPACGSQKLAKLLSLPAVGNTAGQNSGSPSRDLPRVGGGGCGTGCGCH